MKLIDKSTIDIQSNSRMYGISIIEKALINSGFTGCVLRNNTYYYPNILLLNSLKHGVHWSNWLDACEYVFGKQKQDLEL